MPQRHEDMGAGACGFKALGEDGHGSRTRKKSLHRGKHLKRTIGLATWSGKRDSTGLAIHRTGAPDRDRKLGLTQTDMERETRFELATPTLARLCSTTELFPLVEYRLQVRSGVP